MKNMLHGFAVLEECEIAEIGARVYTMRHEGCGTMLYFLKREEKNMTFAIGFQTPPYDDTGVFHILEHSVLCGSEKFPLKDPFVELLKGSVNTFLNAMTYPDMTVYPVSSQNKRDFFNLIDVYMDAVLHPLMLKKKEVFLQEGVRLCENEDGSLSYNGVVYNEMKGAYSSADEVLAELIKGRLYQGTPYAYDSGGNPDAIPSLTYEQFLKAHETYYHPSSAHIVLDGDVDLDEILPLLDEYLSKYEKTSKNANISLQKPQILPTLRREYELPEGESLEGRVRYAMGFGGYSYDERERHAALGILMSYLAGGNESPLKSALLDKGLCEDVCFSVVSGTKEPRVTLLFQNTSEESLPRIREAVRRVIENEVSAGLSRERLAAGLSRMEFSLREADFGTYPRGIVYALRVLEGVMYGADAKDLLSYEQMLANLRENLDTGYYENLLRELFIEGEMYCDVVLTPSHTKAGEDEIALREKLDARRQGMSEEELNEVRADEARLAEWQATPDAPEALASVPMLSIRDIDALPKERALAHYRISEDTVHHFAANTGGITYAQLTFEVSDLTEEELSTLGLLTSLLSHVDTEARGALALRTEIQSTLGSFLCSIGAFTAGGVCDKATACVQVTLSVLNHKRDVLPALLSEILTSSRFTSREQIGNLLKQHRLALEEFVYEGGYSPALFYAEGQISAEMRVYENAEGYTAYMRIKKLEEALDTAWNTLPDTLASLSHRIFTRDRLSLGLISEKYDESFAKSILSSFEELGTAVPKYVSLKGTNTAEREIRIPGTVSHAVRVFNLGEDNTGHMQVVKNLLSYEYLWNEIRVAGGAYGAGLGIQKNGLGFFYSFRDPDAENTDRVFLNSPSALIRLVEDGVAGEKHIIGAISASEPYLTPRSEGLLALAEYKRGITYEDRKRTRKQILETTPDDLIVAARALARCLDGSIACACVPATET